MGEQEQSGMLRTVVVLGLIAIIAGVVIASMQVLRGKMDSTSGQASDQAVMAQATEAANDQLDAGFQQTNINPGTGLVGAYVHNSWDDFTPNGTAKASTDDQGNKAIQLNNMWALVTSPTFTIPDGATKIKISVRTNGPVDLGVFPIPKAGEVLYGYKQSVHDMGSGWRQVTGTIDLKGNINSANGAVTIQDFTNRQVNLQLASQSTTGPVLVSQPSVSFSK